jgi:ubiquitin carboxyl-terminal hydrolase 12/46
LSHVHERQKDELGKKQGKVEEDNMLLCLCDLFAQINGNKKRTGAIPPKKFVTRLRKENEVFRTLQHQDAHEFLNYLLNTINELLQKEMKEDQARTSKAVYYTRDSSQAVRAPHSSEASEDALNGDVLKMRPSHSNASAGSTKKSSIVSSSSVPICTTPHTAPDTHPETEGLNNLSTPLSLPSPPKPKKSFVHELFEGVLASETRCLTCETITSREETFIDLSIDIEQNSSLHNCLRNFSSSETLDRDDKFFCDYCCTLQEAQKCIRIKKAPLVLAIHLKRFKFIERLQRHRKLSYRVPFSMELRLPRTGEDDPDALYHLFAVVIHVGSGPNMGHYVSMVKSHEHWLLFDDEVVEHIPENSIHSVFGVSQDCPGTTQTGYILFYSLNDCATKMDAAVTPPSCRRAPAHTYQA